MNPSKTGSQLRRVVHRHSQNVCCIGWLFEQPSTLCQGTVRAHTRGKTTSVTPSARAQLGPRWVSCAQQMSLWPGRLRCAGGRGRTPKRSRRTVCSGSVAALEIRSPRAGSRWRPGHSAAAEPLRAGRSSDLRVSAKTTKSYLRSIRNTNHTFDESEYEQSDLQFQHTPEIPRRNGRMDKWAGNWLW